MAGEGAARAQPAWCACGSGRPPVLLMLQCPILPAAAQVRLLSCACGARAQASPCCLLPFCLHARCSSAGCISLCCSRRDDDMIIVLTKVSSIVLDTSVSTCKA